MIITTADSILELRMNAPEWVDTRSSTCTAQLVHFDALSGLLQFNTACVASRNTWIQTVVFDQWDSYVTISPEETTEQENLEETEEGEPFEEMVKEEVEKTSLGNESWPEIYGKFPDLINADVKVHCNCPAFLWWGSWYNLEQRDSEIFPEGVPYPGVRDPDLNNVICKHLAAVFAQHF